MLLFLSISLFIFFVNEHSILIECAEKEKYAKADSKVKLLLEKSLADNLQRALNALPLDKIPNEFKQQKKNGDE